MKESADHYYYYCYSIFEFFPPALTDGFSLEFEWQQVSSILHDSSQYSNRLQWWYGLDGLHSSAISKSPIPRTNLLVTVLRAPITIGIAVTFMFHSLFFSIPLQDPGTHTSFHFLSNSTIRHVLFFFFFFCWLLQYLVVWPKLSDPFVS